MAKTVFIVEDEKPLVEALSEYLKSEGYVVEAAYNGNEALKKIDKVKPDVILLDIILPEVNGIAFLKEIQKPESPHKDVPVIVFSNLVGEKKWIADMNLRIADYMIKANSSLTDLGVKLKTILK